MRPLLRRIPSHAFKNNTHKSCAEQPDCILIAANLEYEHGQRGRCHYQIKETVMRTLDYLEIERHARQLQVQEVRALAGKLGAALRHIIASMFASGDAGRDLGRSGPTRA
jgi:hypothetical protein